MNDPRHGTPSCSALGRLENCPVSHQLSKGCEDKPTDESLSGDRVHYALKTGDDSALSPAERDRAEECRKQADKVREEWLDLGTYPGLGRAGGDDFERLTVERLWLDDVLSGEFDEAYVIHSLNAGLIIDFKSSWGNHKHARDNPQLRGYAVLAAKKWNLTHVRVAIIQPAKGAPTLADYGPEELALAEPDVRSTAELAIAPEGKEMRDGRPADAPYPGEWCQYCPAKLKCPALQGKAFDMSWPVGVATNIYRENAEKELRGYIKGMSVEEVGSLLETAKMAEWYIEAIRDDAWRRIEAGETIPGWRVKTVAGDRKIPDTAAAWARAHTVVTADEFQTVLEPSFRKFADLLRRKSGKKINKDGREHATQYNQTVKESEQQAERVLGDAMQRGLEKEWLERADRTLETSNALNG